MFCSATTRSLRSKYRCFRNRVHILCEAGNRTNQQSPFPAFSTTTAELPRPFRILGVQQVAIGSTDRASLRQLWVDVLGVSVQQEGIRLEHENVVEDILDLGGVEIDLMTPINPNKSPKVRV